MYNILTLLLPVILLTGHLEQAQASSGNLYSEPTDPQVEVIFMQERLPSGGEKLGQLNFKTGRKTPCDIHDLMALAKAQAVEKGGNALYVTSIKPPANGKGCFNIEADIYRLQEAYVSTPNPDFPDKVSVINHKNGYTYTESVPEFPGGERQMLAFIIRNFSYPATALRDKVEGKVIVNFVVRADGKVDSIQVKQGVRDDLDQEIVRVIASMPEWAPGYQNGKAVHVAYNVPINLSFPQRKKKLAK